MLQCAFLLKTKILHPPPPQEKKMTGVTLHLQLPVMATLLQWLLSSVPKIRVFKKVTDSTENLNILQTYRGVVLRLFQTCILSRDHDLREHIPHTWASSHDNLFQSNFSAWSSREAILGTTPDWPT